MVVVEEMQKGRIRDLFIPRHVTQIVASWLVHVDLKYKRKPQLDGDLRRIRSGVEKGVLYFVAMIYIGRM